MNVKKRRLVVLWIVTKYPTRVGDFFARLLLGVGYFEVSTSSSFVDKGGVGDFLARLALGGVGGWTLGRIHRLH